MITKSYVRGKQTFLIYKQKQREARASPLDFYTTSSVGVVLHLSKKKISSIWSFLIHFPHKIFNILFFPGTSFVSVHFMHTIRMLFSFYKLNRYRPFDVDGEILNAEPLLKLLFYYKSSISPHRQTLICIADARNNPVD